MKTMIPIPSILRLSDGTTIHFSDCDCPVCKRMTKEIEQEFGPKQEQNPGADK
jgi:hypothetical protein